MNPMQYNDTKMRLLYGVLVVLVLCGVLHSLVITLEATQIALDASQSSNKQMLDALYAFKESLRAEQKDHLSMNDIGTKSAFFVKGIYDASGLTVVQFITNACISSSESIYSAWGAFKLEDLRFLRLTVAYAAALSPIFFKVVDFSNSISALLDLETRLFFLQHPAFRPLDQPVYCPIIHKVFIAPHHLARDVVDFARNCTSWLCDVGNLIGTFLKGRG